MSIQAGLQYEKRLREQEKRQEMNQNRARTILDKETRIREKDKGEPYKVAHEAIRTRYEHLARCADTGVDLPTTGPEGELVARYYGKQQNQRRYQW